MARAKLVVVDECSMVDEKLGRDLLSFGTPVLVLGDPGQLPPVSRRRRLLHRAEPDVMLTEIHRQARDNPIIALAQTVREGGRPDYGRYGDSRVIGRDDIDAEQVLAADQVLVGRTARARISTAASARCKGFEAPVRRPATSSSAFGTLREGPLNGGLWRVSVGTRAGPASTCW